MPDDTPVGGLTVGPLAEHLTYLNAAHQRAEHDFFWSIVGAIMNEVEGGYDDLPEWMTEFASQLLATNQPMESES